MNLNLALVGRNSDFLFAAKTSVKPVYTTTRVENLLLAGIERMALRANVKIDTLRSSGTNFYHVSTTTGRCQFMICWVDISFHHILQTAAAPLRKEGAQG